MASINVGRHKVISVEYCNLGMNILVSGILTTCVGVTSSMLKRWMFLYDNAEVVGMGCWSPLHI